MLRTANLPTIGGMGQAFVDNYRFLARYNQWFNGRLFDACGLLPDGERKRERGAFFGSIHRTLNHLVLADQIWLRRFAVAGQARGVVFAALGGDVIDLPPTLAMDTVLFEDWHALCTKRQALDSAIGAWVEEMPDDYPLWSMRYSNSKGLQREHPAWQAITHFFNHQAHHRGQVTAMVTQAGGEVGVTDLIALA